VRHGSLQHRSGRGHETSSPPAEHPCLCHSLRVAITACARARTLGLADEEHRVLPRARRRSSGSVPIGWLAGSLLDRLRAPRRRQGAQRQPRLAGIQSTLITINLISRARVSQIRHLPPSEERPGPIGVLIRFDNAFKPIGHARRTGLRPSHLRRGSKTKARQCRSTVLSRLRRSCKGVLRRFSPSVGGEQVIRELAGVPAGLPELWRSIVDSSEPGSYHTTIVPYKEGG
jgi:hypothetical protein